MWIYEKELLYPVNITKKNLPLAKLIMTAYGGPGGELAAALRYLNQRYTMPIECGKSLLTDIGTEELAHVEIVCTILKQLISGATLEEIKANGFEGYFTEHGLNFFPLDALGNPFTANYVAVTGDYITDITEDLAAEEKARASYENLMRLTDDEEVLAPLSFLREREIIHYQRFGELLNLLYEYKEKTVKPKP